MSPIPYIPESFVANAQDASINIAVADDYPLLLAGMRQILAPCDDIVVVAECTQIRDLLAQVALKRPEIILFGCETNLDNLAQQLHSITEHNSEVKVIVLTGSLSLDFHEEALRNGAKGVLLKQGAPELIAKTVRKVSRGGFCFERALTDRMLSTFVRRKQTELPPEISRISSLTARENQVISWICEGMSNKQIASKLYISNATVAHHLTSIYRKLDLADRAELLLYARDNGIAGKLHETAFAERLRCSRRLREHGLLVKQEYHSPQPHFATHS